MKTASSRAERREGASQSRARLSDRYQGWLRHHRLSAADSLHRVLEKPVASVLTFLVMGIALALPVGLSVALDNADRLNANWQGPAEISLFLSPQLTEARAVELAESIAGREDVARAHFVSRDQAMEEFRKLSGFADVLDSLEENPLPHLILVTPLEESRASVLSRALQDQPEVAEAVLDRAWLQRLQAIMELSSRLVLAVGALLVFGVVLILGNTIRLAIENRRVSLWYLQVPVNELAVLYGSDFRLRGAGVMGGLNLVVLGAFLGLAGAWLAVARHLSVIEPR
jgi:cell division transport system permease protein